jgi:hypothetical protein
VDFVHAWGAKTEIPDCRFLRWIELGTSKFDDWKKRYGKVNEHNAWVPRDHWLTEEEKRKIIGFAYDHPLEGYRPLTFMMLDADVVAVSPTSVWRVLHHAGLLARVNGKPSRKGTGFVQPVGPHEHWHVDVSYLNIAGTFYFLCSILDGYSRFIVHWDIRKTMEEGEIETIIQRAREMYPGQRPRIISDNGPQFIAKDFKEFIRICGMTHVKTSPYSVQRQDRTLPPHAQGELHPSAGAPVPGGRSAPRHQLRRPLQRNALAQRHRLHRPQRHARRTGPTDLRRPRPQAGRGS